MFDHVTVRASEVGASGHFYETVLAPLGLELDDDHDFRLGPAGSASRVTRGLHVAFVTTSREQVDAFWRAGTSAGYESVGEPGPRPIYSDTYYGGFLLDPDGNSVEAVYHGRVREPPNVIDHLWIRVAALGATRGFWEGIAPILGLKLYGQRADRFHVGAHDRSFALVSDGSPVSRNVELGFPVAGESAVEQLRRARSEHVGATGLLDPDGNRVYAVPSSTSQS